MHSKFMIDMCPFKILIDVFSFSYLPSTLRLTPYAELVFPKP